MSDVEQPQRRQQLGGQQRLKKTTNGRQQLILDLFNRNSDWNGLTSAAPLSVSRYQRRCATAIRAKGGNGWTMLNNPVPESPDEFGNSRCDDPVLWNGKELLGEMGNCDWRWSHPRSNKWNRSRSNISGVQYQYNVNGKCVGIIYLIKYAQS